MATKRIIQLPTLNNWQVTWGNSSQWGYLRRLPNELPWGDWPNPKLVIQTPQTDANGNITGWWWKKTAMNSPEEPEVWTYKWNNGVVQTIDKRVQQGWQPATTYGSKTDRSATLLNTGKSWTTNWLPQATPANLPWVTKYAGIDKGYWNNQAGIDLVNKQNELDTLSEAEKAQRLAGAYNPTPTVATTQNPVIKKTLDKPQEQTVTPAVLQGADMNTLNSTLDELNYKVNVEGKALSKDEYLVYAGAKRQLQDMMKPQALTWGLDGLIANKENEIKQVTDESKINNEQELADFTRSQEVYKQAELDAIEQADEESKKTLWFILWWQGAGQGTFAVEQIGKITQNSLAKKQALNEAVQAKIDLYGSQLRKDSQQTIQAMKDRLDSYYMKAAEFDVDNIKQMNEYNAKEWASKIEQIDKMMALAQSQAMAMQPLTEQEQAQAQAFAGNLYDNEWNFQNNVFEMLYKVNPKLANAAVMQGTAIQKERLSNDLAMKWLDQQIKMMWINADMVYKQAQIEKLRNDMTQGNRTEWEWGVLYDKNTWIRKQDVDYTWSTSWWVQITSAIQKAIQSCTNWAQCGKFVNDVLQNAGKWRLIGDSYESKVNAVSKIWEARNFNEIGTGSIFTYPVKWSNYWHIGIITWVNSDWTINMLDYNYKGTEQQRERLNVNPSEILNLNGKISKPIIDSNTVPAPVNNKPLTDKQFTQSNQVISSFKQDPQVKAFEEAYANGINLLSSLNEASWPWDVAGVFQFMKTLDPQSVVREAEYETAAKSAWVREQFKNIPANKLEGAVLSPSQRVAFWKLAKKFIENKSTIYQTKYEDWIRRLEKQGIDTSVFPTNIASDMKEYLKSDNQPATTGWWRRQG